MVARIKLKAKEKGWSMSHLARQLGLAQSYFTDVKNGKNSISAKRLEEIADLLGTTTDYLLGKTDDPSRPEDMSPKQKEAMELFSRLDDDKAKLVLEMMKTMTEK